MKIEQYISKDKLIGFILIIICILVVIFKPEPKPIYKVSPEKVIETRIENKESDVLELLNQVAVDRSVINSLHTELQKLKFDLKGFKKDKDTVQILRLQDIIIHAQDTTIAQYERMDKRKDSIIVDQRYIIKSKDTLLAVKDHEIKRVKKQRNISLLINAIQTGIIIIK